MAANAAEDRRIERLLFLAQALERSPQPFAAGTADGRLVECNRAFRELVGYGADELPALTWNDDLTPPEWREPERIALAELRRTGQPQRYEKEYRRKDGSRVPVELLVQLEEDAQGSATYCAFVTDLSERKQAEAERQRLLDDIRRQSDFVAQSIDAVPVGIAVVTGRDHRFALANRTYSAIVSGRPDTEVLGRPFAEVFPRVPEGIEFLDGVYRTGESMTLRDHQATVGPQRRRTFWDVDTVPLRDGEGTVAAVLILTNDVTARALALEQAEELSDERRRHLERLARLVDVTETVLAAGSIEELLQVVVDSARELTGARLGTSGHGYRDGVFLVGATSRAEDAPPCPEGQVFAVERRGIYHRLIEGARSVRYTDEEMRARPEWWGLPEGHTPLRGLLGAPLVGAAGLPNGLIMVSDKLGGDFTAEDEALLQQLASLASLGLRHLEAKAEAERRAADLEATFAAMGESIFIHAPSGAVRRMNRAARQLVGYTGDQLEMGVPERTGALAIQDEAGQPVPPERLPTARALAGETVLDQVLSLRSADGQRRWVSISASPVPEADGIGAVATVNDITAMKEIQEQLRQALEHEQAQNQELLALTDELDRERARLTAIIANAPEAVVVADEQARVVLTNEAADRLYARPVPYGEDYASHAAMQVCHPDGSPCDPRRLPLTRSALDGETLRGIELAIVWPDGTRRDLLVNSAPIHGNGGITGAVGLFQDITRRKEEERERERLTTELAAERERLAVTLHSIADGVIVTDTTGAVVLLNDAAGRLTGWSEAEAAGRDLEEVFVIVDERTGERLANPVRRVLASGAVVELANHIALVARDGSRRLLADTAAPVRGRDGEVIGVVLVFQDVTARAMLEEEAARANKLESLGVLAGGIAHDFNNLLVGILGNITLARLEVTPASELAELLAEAEQAAEQARDITHQLLTFARGGLPVKRDVSLGEVLIEAGRFILRGRKSKPVFDIAADLWPVYADAAQVKQVIQNLAINADEAMEKGGSITFRAANVEVGQEEKLPLPAGRYVRVTVADTGCGIVPEVLPRIFDPYFSTKERGSGLGLSVAYSIVTKHEGHILTRSTVGEGSEFDFYLPVSAEAAHAQAEAAKASRGRVLVMDDEDVVRRVSARVLARLGYDCATATEGSEALAMYAQARTDGHPFDAVIVDLVVPLGMGGKVMMERLLRLDPAVRAIVSSGYSSDPGMRFFASYGFRSAITKPFTLDEVQAALDTALR